MIIRNITGYQTSMDYALLWNLGQKQSVVCIVDYCGDCRDACQTLWNGTSMRVSNSGNCYVMSSSADGFVKRCRCFNLEFLIPNQQNQP